MGFDGKFSQPFWSSKRKVTEFCRDRMPQSDAEFIAACRLPDQPDASQIALAVRRAVAHVGKVDPHYIKADDIFPDTLGILPVWDSMDQLSYVLELESELGWDQEISEADSEKLFNYERISVQEMIERVCALAARH